MAIRTKRWNDAKTADDGWRILVCRYRPRALAKKDETWDNWYPDLSPSKGLHAAIYGKQGEAIPWDEFRLRYLAEMQGEDERQMIEGLADLVAEGKTITLLCSSACEDEARCHRSLLRQLIEECVAARPPAAADSGA